MSPIEVDPNLFLVFLDQPICGFKHFISSWIYRGDKTFIVDPGPSGTIPDLFQALDLLEIRHIDAVLLTHVHIDHAGGAGALANRFPATPVVCHHAGIPHLAEPERLWKASRRMLGHTATVYGKIEPVPAALLTDASEYTEHGLRSIPTPGHAAHHVSYVFGPYLFVGEAAGVHLMLSRDKVFLRPATPPRFFLETSVRSIDALLNCAHKKLCYGHFGMSKNTPGLLTAHKSQLYRWAEIIGRAVEKQDTKDLEAACFARLLKEDPLLSEWPLLGDEVQAREQGFLMNSIRGFVQYLKGS
jgi:glyoxylase-like metal-dependent hydrolase (beta-lactamase superfamily II)